MPWCTAPWEKNHRSRAGVVAGAGKAEAQPMRVAAKEAPRLTHEAVNAARWPLHAAVEPVRHANAVREAAGWRDVNSRLTWTALRWRVSTRSGLSPSVRSRDGERSTFAFPRPSVRRSYSQSIKATVGSRSTAPR